MNKQAYEHMVGLTLRERESLSKEAGLLGGLSKAFTKAVPKLFKSKYTTINPRMLNTSSTPRIPRTMMDGASRGMISNPRMPSGGVSVIGEDGIPRRLINLKPHTQNLQAGVTRGNPYGRIDDDGYRVAKLVKRVPPRQLELAHRLNSTPQARAFADRPGAMLGSDGKIY